MPIIKQDKWDECVKKNDDPYGAAAVSTAKRVMEILDEESGEFDCHEIICRGDKESGAGGITGFMAGCVASMIAQFHSRGDEFRRKWNTDNQIGNEGEKANKRGGTLNPALMTIKMKGEAND